MTADRESRAPRTWALALVFGACAVASGERLFDTVAVGNEPVAWAQVVRIASCVLGLATSVVGFVLMRRGHHRRMGAASLAAESPRSFVGASHDGEHETAVARAVTRTFPLTLCILLLAFAVTTYVATFPNEPAFVRVLAATGALITFLWTLGVISSRVRAGKRLRG